MDTRDRADQLRLALREGRLARGLRQIDVAQALDEPQSFVSKYESGERRLTFVEVERICAALDVDLHELIKNLKDMEPG